jgi:tetratricopeptide (TPR) repeat protein
MTGEPSLAGPLYEEALELFRALGDEEEADHLLLRISFVARHAGELDRAERLATKALEHARARGNRQDEALALNNLAMAALAQGDRDLGVRLADEAAAVAESIGFTWWRGVTLFSVAEWFIAAGDADGASGFFRRGLESLHAVPDEVNLPIALAAGAALAACRGDAPRAGTLWGAVEGAAERAPRPTTEQALVEYSPLVESVASDEFERARSQGRSLSIDQAVAYALANLD